jgi:hypothetical protein
MRHADASLPAPEWRAGAGAGGGGGVRSGCDVLHADAFLEFKYTSVNPMGSPSPVVLRLTMQGDGNLVVYARLFSSDEVMVAPFEAVARPMHALNINGIGAGRFVNGFTMYALGRPPYHARLTPRALELVNGLGRVYWELLLPTRFDPARPVVVKFATKSPYPPQVGAALKACGVPRDVACGAGDPDCRSAIECDNLLYNV